MAHKGWLTIKVAPQDVARLKVESSQLGMPMTFYIVQVMRNHWQDPRPLKVLPPPVVNPWQPSNIDKSKLA